MGRFRVLESIGSGGMGRVYAAYDEQLDRKVAIKVLRAEHSTPEDRRRFLREAQAMAQLSHPNIVTVHEVGESDGKVFLAMEFIRGQTLREWFATQPNWREVLEVFVRAGRGLMAAHDAGLVHRDLKPGNIMRGEGGLVKVLDFGLARAGGEESTEDSAANNPVEDPVCSNSELLSTFTRVGTVLGTPAYMSPEQTRGEPVDARSDQFSFCVSLHEGLYGQRPHDRRSVVTSGTDAKPVVGPPSVRSSPPKGRVPRWVHRVLLRGLEPEAANRWPSLEALLIALDRGRRRWRWSLGLTAGAALAIAVGTLAGFEQQRTQERLDKVEACEDEGARIDEIWNDEEKARLRDGMLATGVGFAQDSIDTLTPWLDAYRDQWRTGRVEACMLGTVEHSWDPVQLDRSAWCLEDRRLALEATVDQVAGSTRATSRRAIRIASYLDPIDACLDPNVLERLPAPPMDTRDEIRTVRAILTEVDGHRYAGRYARAVEVAQRGVARAQAISWPPLVAHARFLEGRSLLVAGRPRESEAVLTNAYFEALRAGAIEQAFRSARSLIKVHVELERYAEAKTWARHADALSLQLTDPIGLDVAEGHFLLEVVYRGLRDYASAAKEGEKAVALRAKVLGANHPITAAASRNLGTVYLMQHRPREALDLLQHADVVWRDAVGTEHPYTGRHAVLQGQAMFAMGWVDDGLLLLEQGMAILERVLEDDHPTIADAREQLALVYAVVGRWDDAKQAHARASAIRRHRSVGHGSQTDELLFLAMLDHRQGDDAAALARCTAAVAALDSGAQPDERLAALALERAADVLLGMGQIGEAVERRRDALIHRESARGPSDRELLVPLVRFGDALRADARFEEARQTYKRALAIAERTTGKPQPSLVSVLSGLAEVALHQGDVAGARHLAEQAVQLSEDHNLGPRTGAGAQFALARALAATGDLRRGLTLAEQARDGYRLIYDNVRHAEVERWLAKQEPEIPSTP